MAGSDGRGFHPNVDKITMIVNSGGASDHFVDDELIPRLRDSMKDYEKLKEPKIIVTAGNKEIFATATDTIWGHIIDQAGQRVPGRISAMIVPGFGRNLFASVKAMNSGLRTILKTGNPHIHFNRSTSPPLNHHPETRVCARTKYFFAPREATATTRRRQCHKKWSIATRGRIYCWFTWVRACYIGW